MLVRPFAHLCTHSCIRSWQSTIPKGKNSSVLDYEVFKISYPSRHGAASIHCLRCSITILGVVCRVIAIGAIQACPTLRLLPTLRGWGTVKCAISRRQGRRIKCVGRWRTGNSQEDRNLPPAQCGAHPRIPLLGAGWVTRG